MADENLAELARWLGKMVEHPNQDPHVLDHQPHPLLGADTECSTGSGIMDRTGQYGPFGPLFHFL